MPEEDFSLFMRASFPDLTATIPARESGEYTLNVTGSIRGNADLLIQCINDGGLTVDRKGGVTIGHPFFSGFREIDREDDQMECNF